MEVYLYYRDSVQFFVEEKKENILENQVQVSSVAVVSDDYRRRIEEALFSDGSIQFFVVKDGSSPLGQHYHKNLVEVFYFFEGGGTVSVAKVNGAGEVIGVICQYVLTEGSVIKIPPFHTHRFDLRPGTKFIVFGSRPFDRDDLWPCPI